MVAGDGDVDEYGTAAGVVAPCQLATDDRKLSHGAYASYSSRAATVNATRQGTAGQAALA